MKLLIFITLAIFPFFSSLNFAQSKLDCDSTYYMVTGINTTVFEDYIFINVEDSLHKKLTILSKKEIYIPTTGKELNIGNSYYMKVYSDTIKSISLNAILRQKNSSIRIDNVDIYENGKLIIPVFKSPNIIDKYYKEE